MHLSVRDALSVRDRCTCRLEMHLSERCTCRLEMHDAVVSCRLEMLEMQLSVRDAVVG